MLKKTVLNGGLELQKKLTRIRKDQVRSIHSEEVEALAEKQERRARTSRFIARTIKNGVDSNTSVTL